MSEVNDPANGEFETVNSDLNKGLKMCRSVVDNYRALLSSNDNLTSEACEESQKDVSSDLSAER